MLSLNYFSPDCLSGLATLILDTLKVLRTKLVVNIKINYLRQKMRIAFGYKMGSGKDEAVSYLIRKYGGTRISFATPIYDIMSYAQQRCGFQQDKDRKFLQYVGTEWGRCKEKNIWVRLAIEAIPPEDHFAFISDLRFPNEFEALKENGWNCVKLVRPHREDRKGTGSHVHASELALDVVPDDEWDHILNNDGTLEDFYQKLDSLVNTING